MSQTLNLEWCNTNSLRNYPFREDAKLMPTSSGGTLLEDSRIPNYLIVDFVLMVPTTLPQRIYLSQLSKVGNLLTLVISDNTGTIVTTLAIDWTAHQTNTSYDIVGTFNYSDARGKIVLGDLSTLDKDIAEGLYTFALADSEFEYTTVRPSVRGIRSLQLDNNNTLSGYIFGHVKLLAGQNIQLSYIPAYNTIRIDAIDGGGLNEECDCATTIGRSNIVRQINGIAIEDVTIEGDGSCVSVTNSGNKIIISDVCSTPCCGCPELEWLTQQLTILDTTISNLENYANQLSNRISTFVSTFVLTVST